MCTNNGTGRRVCNLIYICLIGICNILFRTSEGLDDEEGGDTRNKTKVAIMESLSGEDGNYVSNIGNIVAGRVGNIFGKGIGGISNKFGGGTSSWF